MTHNLKIFVTTCYMEKLKVSFWLKLWEQLEVTKKIMEQLGGSIEPRILEALGCFNFSEI